MKLQLSEMFIYSQNKDLHSGLQKPIIFCIIYKTHNVFSFL